MKVRSTNADFKDATFVEIAICCAHAEPMKVSSLLNSSKEAIIMVVGLKFRTSNLNTNEKYMIEIGAPVLNLSVQK
jgi:hypothetical protein